MFALVGLWAGLGISWSQRAVALGIAAVVALVTNLSRELLGYVFMGVSVFATIVAWQYVTGPLTVAALTAAQPAATTRVRYRMLAAWLFLTVAFATPLIRWLQPPVPVFLLGLIMLPMVPCTLTPRHHVAVGAAASACLGLSTLVWPDLSNPFDYKVAFAAGFSLIAAVASLVVSVPFALQTRQRADERAGVASSEAEL